VFGYEDKVIGIGLLGCAVEGGRLAFELRFVFGGGILITLEGLPLGGNFEVSG
jgi:hypothetical protein